MTPRRITRALITCWMAFAVVPASIMPVFAAPPYGQQSAINAAAAGRIDETKKPTLGPMSNAEVQGFGCLYAGGAATVLGIIGGSGQLVQVLTGGAAVSVAPLDFALAVSGTIFAGFCAVGALGGPAVVRMWHQYYDGETVEVPK